YYRLNGITIELPSLAERRDRGDLIRKCIAREFAGGCESASIESEALRQLLAYDWPGNVRELRNVIRTALAICDGGVVRLSDLPSELRNESMRHSVPAREPVTESGAREDLLRQMRACDGNMSLTAAHLGISRNTLYRRCKRLGIPLRRAGPLA